MNSDTVVKIRSIWVVCVFLWNVFFFLTTEIVCKALVWLPGGSDSFYEQPS